MELLKLIKPNKDFENQILEMVQEFSDDGTALYGVGGLKRFIDNYDGRLRYLKENENENTVDDGHVPAIQYILVRESDNSVIGFINARLILNDLLSQRGGHISYSIRPSERKKHYATAQLFTILKFYKDLGIEKVLLTCDKSNIGSAKTIQNCGGILQDEVIDPIDGELLQRYWLNIDEGIKKGNKFFENFKYKITLL